MRPATIGVVEGESTLDSGAYDDDVLSVRARRLDDGAEVQERRDEDALATLRRGHDRTRAVRRREDERRAGGLDVLTRRVAEIEAGDPDRVALAPEDALSE